MPDRYTYPGTEVLVNIPGYTDPAAWKEAETAVVGMHIRDLAVHPIPGGFDLAHLQAIHARLVAGFYTWGGVLRDVDTGPGGTGLAHCRPEFILVEADRIFTTLADQLGFLRGRDANSFSAGLAWVWGETTALHPFRDINSRSQFVFFTQLAHEAGWVIDWNQIDPYVFGHGRTVAIAIDERGIDALIRPALHPVAEVEARERARERMRQASQEFFTPRRQRTRAQLDAELRRAMDERTRHFGPGADPFGPPPGGSGPSTPGHGGLGR